MVFGLCYETTNYTIYCTISGYNYEYKYSSCGRRWTASLKLQLAFYPGIYIPVEKIPVVRM